MKNQILLIILSASIIFTGCTKFLDVKPAGKLIPEMGDVASFEKLLNNDVTLTGGYSNNNGGCRLNYLTDDIEMSNNQANYFWVSSFPNLDSYFAYVYKTPYYNPSDPDLYTWWMDYYRAIEYFNVCIDGVNSVRTESEDQLAKETIAQAKVARAYLFFNLALIYGPVYNPNGTNDFRTIPMRTQSDVMAPMEDLSTNGEIFTQVLKDIHSSLKVIPELVASPARFGKVATLAFLSHYHLFTQKYDSVALYANQALTIAAAQRGGIDNLFYDYNKFTWADAGVATDPNKKNASTINTSQGSDPLTANYHREMLLYRKCSTPPGSSYAYPSQSFINLFTAGHDLRRDYFFFEYNGYKTIQSGVTYDDGRRIINYQNKMARTSGFSYPELLLLRAEGRARTNDLAGAISDINLLRRYRMKPGFTLFSSANKDEVIQEVLNERRRELPVGSQKRFFDLKRFVLETGKPWSIQSITHTVNGTPYTAQVNSEYFRMPIQNDVILKNPHWGLEIETRPWSSQK